MGQYDIDENLRVPVYSSGPEKCPLSSRSNFEASKIIFATDSILHVPLILL